MRQSKAAAFRHAVRYKLFPALTSTLVSAYRADFCVGFFNLRGWGLVANQVDHFAGGEGQCCRVLMGMNERPDDELRAALRILKTDDSLDLQRAAQLRRQVAEAFRDQLTHGAPSNADERALQQLAQLPLGTQGADVLSIDSDLDPDSDLAEQQDFDDQIVSNGADASPVESRLSAAHVYSADWYAQRAQEVYAAYTGPYSCRNWIPVSPIMVCSMWFEYRFLRC